MIVVDEDNQVCVQWPGPYGGKRKKRVSKGEESNYKSKTEENFKANGRILKFL